jgi:hypothetical protein
MNTYEQERANIAKGNQKIACMTKKARKNLGLFGVMFVFQTAILCYTNWAIMSDGMTDVTQQSDNEKKGFYAWLGYYITLGCMADLMCECVRYEFRKKYENLTLKKEQKIDEIMMSENKINQTDLIKRLQEKLEKERSSWSIFNEGKQKNLEWRIRKLEYNNNVPPLL